MDQPHDVAVDSAGNVYIAGKKKHVIRKITAATGIIETVVGIAGSAGYSGDGGPAVEAQINEPVGIAVRARGDLYIAEKKSNVIRFADLGGYRIVGWQEVAP